MMLGPSYLSLYYSGELKIRADRLKARLTSCDICPRNCHVNRMEGETGICLSAYQPLVASFCDHHGEEPPISGTHGSGTIFFANCNLRCVFCQNYQVSQNPRVRLKNVVSIEKLAEIMLYLQNTLDCHNINLVSPGHFVPQIVEALLLAIPRGLNIPLVYNTNAYDAVETLRELDDIIDIYLPDIKYATNQTAIRYSHAPDYAAISRASIKEMHHQVGNFKLDDQGIATKGLIIRHLILPNGIAGSEEVLRWIRSELGSEVTISLMSQYQPVFKAGSYPEINRPITHQEYKHVLGVARELGLENVWAQGTSSPDNYLPDFEKEGHPFVG